MCESFLRIPESWEALNIDPKCSTLVVKLLDVVLALVGGLVAELLILLIGNGCALVILELKLTDLINCLGLGGLLPWP